MTNIWSEAIQGLQPRLGAQTYDLWIRPLELRQVHGQRLYLTAPNRFMKEWFENHYRDVVLDEIALPGGTLRITPSPSGLTLISPWPSATSSSSGMAASSAGKRPSRSI